MGSKQIASVTMTVDVVLLRFERAATSEEPKLHVLLIKRGKAPYAGQWAIPGGKLDADDVSLEDAAARELREETGLGMIAPRQIATYGKRDRDPRGRFVSVAFCAFAADGEVRAGDDAALAQWCPVDQLPGQLAFDHVTILEDGLRGVEQLLCDLRRATMFLPSQMTLYEIGRVKACLRKALAAFHAAKTVGPVKGEKR